jgi:hypothetical protein
MNDAPEGFGTDPPEFGSRADPRASAGRHGSPSADRGLRDLIALAKKMPHVESSRRDAASYVSFETRLFTQGRKRRVRMSWALAGASTCAVLAVALLAGGPARFDLPWSSRDNPALAELSYVVQPIALAAGDVSGHAADELAFSDGSRVQLAERSQASVAALTRHGAHVVLKRGRAEVSVARRKNAAWQLSAGPYTVRVTGTAFRLAWSPEQEELEIAMHHGSVVVTGPMAEQGVTLGKGQRLVGSPRSRRLLVEDVPISARAAEGALRPQPAVASAAASAPASVAKMAKPAARAERPRVLGEHGWAKKVAQGEFGEVVSEAQELGLSRVLDLAAASDLGALADAARYARKDALGQKALLALRERFPGSEPARDSAFLLGRLSRDRRALSWYERYLSEQPKGAYVAQALGRSMMLCYELGDAARAKSLADSYLLRFPSGPYATSARKLSAAKNLPSEHERADHASP